MVSLVPRPHPYPQERGTMGAGGHDQDSTWHELGKTPIKPHRVSSAQRMKISS